MRTTSFINISIASSLGFFGIFGFLVLIINTAHADGVYKWKDARGVIQYGDEPPKNGNVRPFAMPAITVIENYGEQWKPLQNNSAPVTSPTRSVAAKPIIRAPVKVFKPSYNSLRFIAPKSNQIIKAKDGDVSAMISLKPPLKKGHKVIFVPNGKNAGSSKSRISNFKNLSNGSHSVSANIVDLSGNIVMKGAVVPFQVKR